jgi:hypothetical protein
VLAGFAARVLGHSRYSRRNLDCFSLPLRGRERRGSWRVPGAEAVQVVNPRRRSPATGVEGEGPVGRAFHGSEAGEPSAAVGHPTGLAGGGRNLGCLLHPFSHSRGPSHGSGTPRTVQGDGTWRPSPRPSIATGWLLLLAAAVRCRTSGAAPCCGFLGV